VRERMQGILTGFSIPKPGSRLTRKAKTEKKRKKRGGESTIGDLLCHRTDVCKRATGTPRKKKKVGENGRPFGWGKEELLIGSRGIHVYEHHKKNKGVGTKGTKKREFRLFHTLSYLAL